MTTSSPIAGIVRHLRNEPSRTWSIVITIFGDVVSPRGGSLWLGSLLPMFEGMDIQGGVVRTAMSRLAADSWFQRVRVGRNSFYSLTDSGRASFARAAERIYGAPRQDWDGQFDMLLSGDGADRDDLCGVLAGSGYGNIAPGVWISPTPAPLPSEAAGLIRLQARTDVAAGRQLVARAWSLGKVSGGYHRFVEAFTPLRRFIAGGGYLPDLDCLVARILLIHEYRRVVLRDPLLPGVILPEDWPGLAARRLASEIYHAMLAGSEAWLDQNGHNEAGALPPPDEDLGRRFAAPPVRPDRLPECVTEKL